jgi:protein tyrosine phosphatase
MKNLSDGKEHSVKQYHTVGWPDRKIPLPQHYKYVLQMIKLMQEAHAASPSPIVVHCSAGIGRTGTLIALYFLITLSEQQIKATQPVSLSIFGTVRSLREQRFGAVQTAEQYDFIYEFLKLYFNKQLA